MPEVNLLTGKLLTNFGFCGVQDIDGGSSLEQKMDCVTGHINVL